MVELKKLEETLKIRIFEEQIEKINKIIGKAKTFNGTKKYESVSHFVRCAVNRLIHEEKKFLDIRGRNLK